MDADTKMPWGEEGSPVEERRFDSAEKFFDALVSTTAPWGSNIGEWCFRGQDNAKYGLTASLWRPGAADRFHGILSHLDNWAVSRLQFSQPINDGPERATAGLLLKERVAVQHFLIEADRLGLDVRIDASDLENIKKESANGDWIKKFRENIVKSLPDHLLASYAMAQHHGIPTQLLDFTTDPMIAAYFAVPQPCPEPIMALMDDEFVAVWALHRKRLEAPGGELRFVNAPNSDNHYLRTQRGTFVLDTTAARQLAAGEITGPPCITRHIRNSHTMTKPPTKNVHCFKYSLMLKEAQSLKGILNDRGLRKSSLMPTFDNVAKDILDGTLIRTFGAIG